MSAELVGFLAAFGGMIITALGFWLKSVIPSWFKNKQTQENKKLDAEIDIKRISINEEFKRDSELHKSYLDTIKAWPEMIEAVRNLALNVDKGFNSLSTSNNANHGFAVSLIENAKENVKEFIQIQLEQSTNRILNEIKDKKIDELVSKVENLEKAPESRLRPS